MIVSIHEAEMMEVLEALFLKHRFSVEKAKLLARVHTENTLFGVNSHGINRVPRFIDYVERGIIQINANAEKVESFGSIERWDGNLGPGVTNAITCTNRALELAKSNGMGLVALRNTNHWMRGGYYGWQAADEGCISIMFTNTQANMPAWGGQESRLGNNPFIVAIPRQSGHVVLDMAISQFSFGKIHEYKLRGEVLPYPGGWDADNQLSKDPAKILKTERALPIGYWKGSALSMVLDILATLLSAGNSTYRITKSKFETAVSQVFLCIHPRTFRDEALQERLLDEIIRFTHDVSPMSEGQKTSYPGERALNSKNHNLMHGMEVSKKVWDKVLEL